MRPWPRAWARRSSGAAESAGSAGSGRDAASVKEPVALECGLRLRGSIDLVETHADGRLRATDHKTGKVRAEPGSVVSGGEILQPVLYALAIERILPGEVTSGRLYYCTSTGDYRAIDVPLNTAVALSFVRYDDVMLEPGANRSTQLP